MKKKIKLGIVGFGGFGKFLFQAFNESRHLKVTAIADLNINSDTIFDNIDFFNDWKNLVDDTDIDAVLVATPPASHYEITKYALNAKKHVCTEKPLTIKPEEAYHLKELAHENNRVIMVDFLQRFNPLLNKLHQLHSRKLFGPLERYYVENYAQDETLPENHWFWNQDISGGIITEHAVHFIDIVHWFENQPILSIHGNFDFRNELQQDRVYANIHYQNGLIASHYHSFTRPNIFERTKMRFVFAGAQFDFKGWIPETGEFTLLANEEIETSLSIFPNLEITNKVTISSKAVRGKENEYTQLIEGKFKSSLTKQELYSNAIRDIFEDFCKKISNDSHSLKVTIDDAIKAVHVANKAKLNASKSNYSSN